MFNNIASIAQYCFIHQLNLGEYPLIYPVILAKYRDSMHDFCIVGCTVNVLCFQLCYGDQNSEYGKENQITLAKMLKYCVACG